MDKATKFVMVFCIVLAVLIVSSWVLYFTSPTYRDWYGRKEMDANAIELGYTFNDPWFEKEAVIDGSIWTMRWTKDAWYAINKGGKLDVSVKDSLGNRPCIEVKLVAEARE